MSNERACKRCGGAFTTGKHQRIKYCSEKCARAMSSNTNRLAPGLRQKVPTGHRFVRADDMMEVMVLADSQGLPYAEPIRGAL